MVGCLALVGFILFLSREVQGFNTRDGEEKNNNIFTHRTTTLPNEIKNVKQFSVFFSAYSCFCTCMALLMM